MIENVVNTQWAFERYPKLRQINFCGENFRAKNSDVKVWEN